MRKNFVKIFLVAGLSFATLGTFTSCSSNDDSNNNGGGKAPVEVADTNLGGTNGISLKKGQSLHLTADKSWKLSGPLLVGDGATLTIDAGTTITASGGTSSYLAVAQGGKIFINGTAQKPVIFTASEKKAWGGIVVCGKASINTGASSTSEVGNLPYGGTNDADNSGVIKYVQIKHAGARFTSEKEFNGLSLFGVGNGTVIEGVSVIDGADDGIEFFGGTVNVSKVVSINNEDDAIDWTDGWRGTLTDAYARRDLNNIGNRGIEADNNKNNNDASPRSNPTLRNITLVGHASTQDEKEGTNLFRVGTYATLDNVVVSGWAVGFTFKDKATIDYFSKGKHITNVKFENVATKVNGIEESAISENEAATGAGAGTQLPDWAKGWSGYNQ
ncbi:hypothetical protein [Ornithobacterium rhinotracheale]|uniref:hypothetical protein n=1 Tax=Ornithobacterium rhinotracheale TaxID=28251 RepID=UPI0040350AA7